MINVDHFITGETFGSPSDYVREKRGLLERDILNRNGRITLGEAAFDAVTAWRVSDPINELLEIVALAAALETSRGHQAINQAILTITPQFVSTARSQDRKTLETIVQIAIESFGEARFVPDYTHLCDLVDSQVPLSAGLLASLIRLLADESKQGGQTMALQTAIELIFSDTHFSSSSFDYRDDFSGALVRQFSTKFWANELQILKMQANEGPLCPICKFVERVFGRADPFLLIINLPPANDWLLDPSMLREQLSYTELEYLITTKGYQMALSEFRPSDLRGPEFFERNGDARRNSQNHLKKFRKDNVVTLRVVQANKPNANPSEEDAR